MNQPSYDEEVLLAYLHGELDAAKAQQLEAALTEDLALRQRLDAMRIGYQALRVARRDTLQAEWEDASSASVRPMWTKPLYWGLAAASLVLVMLLTWRLWPSSQSTQLAQTAFAPYPGPGTLMGAPDHGVDPLELAFGRYAQADYEAALPLFEEIKQQGNAVKGLPVYQASAHFALGNYQEALEVLEETPPDPQDVWFEAWHWYRALSLLALGQEETAVGELGGLARTSQDLYGYQARDLLQALQQDYSPSR